MEKMLATKRLRLAMETDEERKARLEKMVATTQLKLALETEDERRAKNGFGFNLGLDWIQNKKKLKRGASSPCNKSHFLVIVVLMMEDLDNRNSVHP